MAEKKNLVKDLLLEKNVIDPDKLMYNYFYEGVEWFAYKLSDNTMRYISYELVTQGIGYAFCVTIQCDRLSYDVKTEFYSKSFTNDSTGEWKELSDKFRDKLISDTMEDLNTWGNRW